VRSVYPETAFGGFTRYDGTIAFTIRVRSLLKQDQTVLDVGCGRGSRVDDQCELRRGLQDLRGDSRHVIGIDPDPAAKINPYLDEFRKMDLASKWPVNDGQIDLIYCDYVLEHIESPTEFFAEVARVLKPGGVACFRTPNRWSYVGLIAQIVPNRFHAGVTRYAQQGREARDVFPTLYRCNSRSRLLEYFDAYGLNGCAYTIESEPTYLAFSPLLYRLGAWIHPILPPALRSTLLGFARRP
jgi:SAM-dependent methyltransferase